MDQLLSRKEALTLGSKQYFTGNPCKNGHVSYRYTASGTCAECISESNSSGRVGAAPVPRPDNTAQLQEMRQRKVDLRYALSDLVKVKELVLDEDARLIFDTAVGLCIAAHPVLAHHEFHMPVLNGVPILTFLCPVKHVQMLRDTSKAIWETHKIDTSHVTAVRDRLMKEAETPIPEWAEKP